MKFLLFIVFVFLAKAISGKTIIKTLPGYNRNVLNFTLETGYVGVENDVKQLFYYFVESQRDPETDILLVWNSGGPAYSSLWGFFYEHGPLKFDTNYNYDGTLPTLLYNENSWTKYMNILYVDGPAGTGFSYSTGSYDTGNYAYGSNLNEFVHKWLLDHERFKSHPIYLASDGFGGNFIPLALVDIQKDNEDGVEPFVNLQGYVLIGPGAYFDQDYNARYPYANRVGLVPDDIFEPAYQSCNGSYRNPPNEKCKAQMAIIEKLIENINTAMWLEPACGGDFQLVNRTTRKHRSLQEIPSYNILKESTDDGSSDPSCEITIPPSWCRSYLHGFSDVWANFEGVFDALGVEPGTKPCFSLYNKTLDQIVYNKSDITNLVPIHKQLSNTKLDALIMCGDHDMDIPCLSSEKWISSLDLTEVEKWRTWSVLVNETAGYTRKFINGDFTLTYAVVKGGGHFVPQYRPVECYKMVGNWTDGIPL